MAKQNSTSADVRNKQPQDVRAERYGWGDMYIGSKAALVAAGVAADGLFPGDPGRGSYVCSYCADGTPVQQKGRNGVTTALSIEKYGKKFRVHIRLDEAGQARRREEIAAAAEWRKKAAEAEVEVKRAADQLKDLPSSGREFSERAAKLYWNSFRTFYHSYYGGVVEPGDSGYWFGAEDRETILNMANGMYMMILEAEPRFDAERRMRKVSEARAKAAKVDMPLQRLLTTAASSKHLTAAE